MGALVTGMGGAWGDQDLGASGIVLVESSGIGLVSGKDGLLYTLSLAHPGETAATDLAPAKAPANYARLAARPIMYTYFDPTIDPATPNPATLNRLIGNVTHHLHGTPVYWVSAAHGPMHFCGGENGNLRPGPSVRTNRRPTSVIPPPWRRPRLLFRPAACRGGAFRSRPRATRGASYGR